MVSDEKLITILYTNPEKGLEILMKNYTGLVYTIVYNQLSNILSSEDIEECVSDIFFEVFRHKDRINLNKGSIKGFLAVVSKRKAIDLYRRYKNEINIKIPIDTVDISNDYGDISTSVSIEERNNILLNTIKSLGEPDSEIMIRKYYFRQSSKDISKILDIKANTIDKKASRCINKLKNILGGIL
ncbi:MAG: sigma-70 family RNA polymerase sigma factor [Romboutsia sp.]|uniref:sigma-70 family RNA polymerase sigma factor n=1 Tax=Romboutsia sp. TaxID=1965302 RepID=UPI003F365B91